MGKTIDLKQAQKIMGQNFIGPDEIMSIEKCRFLIRNTIPEIPFSEADLIRKKNDYLLILGTSLFSDQSPVTIRNLITKFGKSPDDSEPCFYNQDWYNKEDFIDEQMADEWYLIRINVYDKSRAIQPDELENSYSFPAAIKCTYTFFVTWLSLGIKLWYHDFVWCNNKDHNGDRIYVGKYHDVDGINKNGFNIHRHLALRDCYGCID